MEGFKNLGTLDKGLDDKIRKAERLFNILGNTFTGKKEIPEKLR